MENLSGDVGAKALLSAHTQEIFEIETGDSSPLADIDTPEEFARYSASPVPVR
jgi:CTP:molybdopterin cytidylyltransferase MocA